MTTGIIIQARTTSTRLPQKVLLKLPYNSKLTVLDQVIRRCKLSKLAQKIIVATTNEKKDTEIIKIAKKNKVLFFRGSKNDVLERYYYAAISNKLDNIVRITSDCPFVDYRLVDKLIKLFLKSKADYASNTIKRTFPHGMDCEVFSFKALEKSFLEAKLSSYREHVTPFIYNNPDRFKIKCLVAHSKFKRPNIRITLDTEEDYALCCSIYDYLYKEGNCFHLNDVIKLLDRKQWLLLINRKVMHKKIFKNLKEELKVLINYQCPKVVHKRVK